MYDPANNVFSQTSGVPFETTERRFGSFGPSSIGSSLYIIGGVDSGVPNYQLPTWRYDASDGSWTTNLSACSPGVQVGVVALGGYLYRFGGIDDTDQPQDIVEKYDPSSDTWTVVGHLPIPNYGFGLTTDGTYIYLAGGAESSAVWKYDPTTNQFMVLPSLPGPTVGAGLAYYQGALYLFGGNSSNVLYKLDLGSVVN